MITKRIIRQSIFSRLLVASILIFTISHLSFGQPVNQELGDVVQPAPNAAALGKYGEIPVSHSTGAANVSVPIHTLQEGSLSLPVSINYHASGIKVGEMASWVGMGWSLNAGGIISRVVLGIKDETANIGYADVESDIEPTHSNVQEIANGSIDGEPDMFNFNFNGYTGKFLIDYKNGVCQPIPSQDIRVEYYLRNAGGSTGRVFHRFVITRLAVS
jgi:hypothetical protein